MYTAARFGQRAKFGDVELAVRIAAGAGGRCTRLLGDGAGGPPRRARTSA
jgi:hypothetical protein